MKPMAVSGTPDGLGKLDTKTSTVLGVGLLLVVVWALRNRAG